MLKKLDIYIIKKYLGTFLFTILMITMIAIAIDFFEKVDKFLKDDVTVHQIVFDYYLNFIPWINGLLWPLFALLAVIFFTSRLAGDSEIISMLSAGISYQRIMRPYLIASIILASIHWTAKNYLIPHSNKIKGEFESEYIRKSNKKTLKDNTHFFLNKNEKVYIKYFRRSDSTANTFRLEKFKQGNLSYVLKARKLEYLSPPNNWKLVDFEWLKIDSLKEELYLSHGESYDTTFNFTPQDVFRYFNQMEMMNTTDLRNFIAVEQSRGIDTATKYKTELYSRTSDPFTIIILTLLGLAIASRKTRGGMGLHLAMAVMLGSAFVILSKFSMTFSANLGMHPLLGAWIPNIIFGIITIYLVRTAQK
ncbi:MAG: LptF/LptG family permease [Saprospiraceae bacterium]